MKITVKWLEKESACSSGVEWFAKQTETDSINVVKKLIAADKIDWANWLIVRVMNYKQYVSYGIYAAEQVIDIFEKQHPGDNRPRNAIEAAKKCVKNKTKKNISAADSAYSAVYSAYSAYSAADSAKSAADSAYSAADSAADSAVYSAVYSAYSAAYSAVYSAYSAVYSADPAYSAVYPAYSAAKSAAKSADLTMKIKILNYGLKLLEGIC